MALKAAMAIVALQGLVLSACGTGNHAATPSTAAAGATVVTTRTGASPTTEPASALPEGVPDLLTPPPGAQIVPAAAAGMIALQVGADPSATFDYYAQRLASNGYRLAQTHLRDGTGSEIVFGSGHDGGAIATSGTAPNLEVLGHVTTFPTTPSLPKPFRLPTGMFRYDFGMIDGIAHHYLFFPRGGTEAQESIRAAVSDTGYTVSDGPVPAQRGGTASFELSGFGASARIDFYCDAESCLIELYRTS